MNRQAVPLVAFWRGAFLAFVFTVLQAWLAPAAAQTNNQCDQPGEEPDVIVGDLHQKRRWGAVGTVTSFSVGTYSCNIGTCWLNWTANNNNHPVIGQSMYRLKAGRFEHIGQSWLKHGFFALSNELCSGGCFDTDGGHLGVNCADPYSAPRNGDQPGLGPKFEVNPSTGVFPYPATDMSQTGNTIYKRIQVQNADLDPAQNAGAQYFVEGQYVAKDDAAAGNNNNNASYRPISVFQSGSTFDFNLTGVTQREMPAIQAWQDTDPTVELDFVDIPNDGRVIVGAKVTDLGNGMWHYEYAVQNLNSHRAVKSVAVRVLGVGNLQNVGFHDVPYHSGEPMAGTDWPATVSTASDPNVLTWATEGFELNANANAVRWGTLYNYRFDVDIPPVHGPLTLELFRGGSPSSVVVDTWVPGLCNLNSTCDAGEDLCDCVSDCEPAVFETGSCFDTLDNDCDGQLDCADASDCCGESACGLINADQDAFGQCEDCNDQAGTVWSTPTEVLDVTFNVPPQGATLRWIEPADMGGTEVTYDVLRSESPSDFMSAPSCFTVTSKRLIDTEVPALGVVYNYLVRATNACAIGGQGPLGDDSTGQPRVGASCP